ALKVQLQTITQQLTAITPLAAQSYNLSNFKELAVSAYQQRLQAVLKLIAKNKLQKVVLGRFATAQIPPAIPEAIWLQLRQSQPQVYHVLLQDHTTAFLSATPERLLAINHQQLQTAAVAGSIRRGTTPGQDKQLQQQLLHDTKNLKEHAFVSNWLQQALQQLHLQVE
ncbi:hypothetical protein EQ500_12930, partial [Lactobacillus sp. XV13L]|nr:hypothetical protein [Lactobacillus sp. XV13L]